MKINLLDKIICRTPSFGLHASMADALDELKLKIRESSPAFAAFIDGVKAHELGQLNQKIRFTLWKYFNRAKFRSTPFGSFAAVSMVPISQSKEQIFLARSLSLKHFTDWGYKEEYRQNCKLEITEKTVFLANSSIYATGDEIRYIRLNDNVHELAAVINFDELQAVLTICKNKTSGKEIFELTYHKFSMTMSETSQFLEQLINLQLLNTSDFPNITGTDYFERLNIRAEPTPQDYIIAYRKHLGGSFQADQLKNVPELIAFLTSHSYVPDNADLRNFKAAFLRRFEHQEVSLATIMDPEIGIGYGNLAQHYDTNPLISEIKEAKPLEGQDTISYSDLHAFLLNKIIDGKPIRMEEFEGKKSTSSAMLPNTFSILFHLYHSKPVIAIAGGCTANSLIGRFTMGDQEIANFGYQISKLEADANPEVAFFDIAYQAEKRVDNVNRRKSLYPSELPILTWSEHPHPLDFSDIMVSVYQDEVILRSKKLNKRIVPRIPSAYNYTRSDLAAYRFVCDVQNQGLHTNLGFKLQHLFPKLKYYPRVSYKDIVLSPATWKVPSTTSTSNQSETVLLLKKWLNQQGINFKFKTGDADHTLCFDPSAEEDIWAFAIYCKQQPNEIYISEALIDPADCVMDQHDTLYVPEFIAQYYHCNNLYRPFKMQHPKDEEHDRIKLPGSEWLYFELYIHAAKGSHLLLHKIYPFLKDHAKHLKKWFFIRYTDPSSHIRLRLHLKNKNSGFQIIDAIRAVVEPEMKSGRLTDFKIKTYFRETDRYGAERLDLVEHFFCLDSKYIFHVLKMTTADEELILNGLHLTLQWLEYTLPELIAQIGFVEQMAQGFAQEMLIGHDHYKKINANFNAIKLRFREGTVIAPSYLMKYKKHLHQIMGTTSEEDTRKKLLADFIHMHINRLFSADQRMYETIIYHYMLKILQTKRARLRAGPEFPTAP